MAMTLSRRSSVWRLDALARPTETDAAETLGYYRELVLTLLTSVAAATPNMSNRLPHGGWAISDLTLAWLVALAAKHHASEPLLVATLRDANTRRVFRDDAYDFERSHFEHFLALKHDDQRRAQSA